MRKFEITYRAETKVEVMAMTFEEANRCALDHIGGSPETHDIIHLDCEIKGDDLDGPAFVV